MRLIPVMLALAFFAGCSEKEIRQNYERLNASIEEVPLTENEVRAALRDALARGITRGASMASAKDGYLGNSRLKIEFPPDVVEVEKALRKAGFGNEVDRFVRRLNRSAEQAASLAKPIFIKAITEMSIGDAFEILNGPEDAATRYLERRAGDDLRDEFLPVVRDQLDETSATRYYGEIVETYNRLPFVSKVDPDLVGYATDRAIDGLFVLIADEEAKLRANPRARTTRLLRRVFGSLD